MGNADITTPYEGFQDPQLAKLFATQGTKKNEHTQSRLSVGAIAGGIVGSIVFVLFLAVVFLLRRRQQRMVEMQDCRLHELHDSKHVPELPTLPIELDGSVPETS